MFDLAAGWTGLRDFIAGLSLDAYRLLGSDAIYVFSYLKSLEIATLSTAILLLLGYPIAYGIARCPRGLQPLLMMLVILPFWTSFLIRIYAWINILQHDGLLNGVLLALGIIGAPVAWLSSDTAIYIGIVYSYLPFMVLPIYATLEKMDETLLEAAADPGCARWTTFWLVTAPLSLRGVLAGALLCFIPIVGEFVIPDLLGGSDTLMIGQTLWTEFFSNKDWPVASAIAVALLCLLVVPIMVYERLQRRALGEGAAMKSRPIALQHHRGRARPCVPLSADRHSGDLFVQRFAAGDGVGRPWSLHWYRELFSDAAMLESAGVSFRLALLSATGATVLGTLAAVALTRMGRFPGRTVFSGMIYAPLVMPEVITGLSLLLLFVAFNVDRGFWTIAIAHTTLTMCFVTVIVQARLAGFDRSLEDAAMDLGCPPLRTFLTVTLPLIAPAIAAGWMLAFSLSLDDLVIASFTTGPGATTLPIRIYSEVRLGVKPEINAVCTIMIALVATGTVAASLMAKRGAVRRERAALAAQV